MPGQRAKLRNEPAQALEELEREGQTNMALIRKIVMRAYQLGPCQVGDPNRTRALAINAVDFKGRSTPQFFAVITDQHKGYHKFVGPRGFSIMVAFREGSGARAAGPDWVSDRFDYIKVGQIWWRNVLSCGDDLDVDSIMSVVALARNSFLCDNSHNKTLKMDAAKSRRAS